MPWTRHLTIGRKLFISTTALLLVALSAQGWLSAGTARQGIETAVTRILGVHGDRLAAAIDGIVRQTDSDLEVVGAHKSIVDALTYLAFEDPDSASEELGVLESFLHRLHSAKPQYRELQLSHRGRPILQLDDGERTEQMRDLRDPAAGDVQISHRVTRDGTALLLESVAAVSIDGRVEGAIRTRQAIGAVIDETLDRFADDGVRGVIFDRDGTTLAHSKGLDAGAIAAIGNGEGWIVREREVASLGWRLLAAQPTTEALAGARELILVAFGTLAGALLVAMVALRVVVRRVVVAPLTGVIARMQEIAAGDGDLRVRIASDGHDEAAQLGAAFNSFVAKIQQTVAEVIDASASLEQQATELHAITDRSAGSVDRQRCELELVATAIQQMSATIAEIARATDRAATLAGHADTEAGAGTSAVEAGIAQARSLEGEVGRASAVIAQLGGDVEGIGAILATIQGISEQTNLLALNAAIEAARAGDQGRGFAVVADEVRHLAQRSQAATQEIEALIERIQQRSSEAISVMEQGREKVGQNVSGALEVGGLLERTAALIGEIRDHNTQIATGTEEQAVTAADLANNLTALQALAQQSANDANQTATSSDTLAGLALKLKQTCSRFEV